MADTNPPTIKDEVLNVPETSPLRRAAMSPVEKNRFAPMILGTLIILLLLVLAGLYYWHDLITQSPIVTSISNRPTEEQNQEPESTTARAQTDAMETLSTSDEIPALEADIEGTNLETLDSELNAIDAELEAALQANP